ncbi:MAG TPA: NUDIX domain-containing protein [archaeon]|nr:NUDIX domain-containing protein [archaeon]
MECRVIVAAIIEKDGKLLLGQKPNNVGPYPNTWHLLGGGIKLGEESIIDALKREIREEANIEITDIQRVSFDEDYEPNKHGEKTHYIFLVFKAKHKSGDPKASDDITELKWIDKSQLSKIKLARPSIKLFKELGYI